MRRSEAIGILAQPALALQLLAAHRHDPATETEPPPADNHHGNPDIGPGEPNDDSDTSPGHRSLRTDPPTAAQSRLARPGVVLHYHLSDAAVRAGHGTVRPEHGEALTLNQLKQWLADTGCPITVKPVFDPADVAPVDGYEIPHRTRDAVRLRNLADVFPYGSATTATMDLDHTKPYLPMNRGGPPGQTSPANLGPMTRTHHRAVTHSRWGKRQPHPGQFVFRSPHGYIYLVTNQGTQSLGTNGFAQAIWDVASYTRSRSSGEPATSAPR